MTNTIQFKSNAVAGTVPGSLALAEPAICTADGRFYMGSAAGVDLLAVPTEAINLGTDGSAITTTVSFTAIPTLVIPVLVGEKWVMEFDLIVLCSTTTNLFALGFTALSGNTGFLRAVGTNGAPNTGAATVKPCTIAIDANNFSTGSVFGNTGSTTLPTWVKVWVSYNASTTAGNFGLSGEVSAGNIIVKLGSYVRAWRMS